MFKPLCDAARFLFNLVKGVAKAFINPLVSVIQYFQNCNLYKPPKYKTSKQQNVKYNILTADAAVIGAQAASLSPSVRFNYAESKFMALYENCNDADLLHKRFQDITKEQQRKSEVSNSLTAGLVSGLLSGIAATIISQDLAPITSKSASDAYYILVVLIASFILGIIIALAFNYLAKIFCVELPSDILDIEANVIKTICDRRHIHVTPRH